MPQKIASEVHSPNAERKFASQNARRHAPRCYARLGRQDCMGEQMAATTNTGRIAPSIGATPATLPEQRVSELPARRTVAACPTLALRWEPSQGDSRPPGGFT